MADTATAVETGMTPAPIRLIKGIGNRYRIAYHENKVDDMIAPESGISGWIYDKVEDVTNFVTMGAVARIKDGIKAKGYGALSGEEMETELAKQYSANVTAAADKKAEKQAKKWAKLEKKMDSLSAADAKVDVMRKRAEKADALVPTSVSEQDMQAEIN